MPQKWVCQTWKEDPDRFPTPHVFTENTEDGFCPEDPPYHGILLRDVNPDGPEVSISFPEDNSDFA